MHEYPRRRNGLCLAVRGGVLVLLWAVVPDIPAVAQFTDGELEFFEKKIRPVLAEHCSECHGSEAEPIQGGLRTDFRESLLRGGDSGPAIVPHQPEASILLSALQYDDLYQMPPSGRLPQTVVADFEKWIQMGAPAPAADSAADEGAGTDSAEAQRHWAFQSLGPTSIPPGEGAWATTPVDRFVLARLQETGLLPSPAADKHTLIRRAFFDLVGLPPTPEQVRAFVADDSPQAFAKVVDGLLASPRYGERWGRHWLDLARYADTNGADENYVFPNAWRYRDYVVRAFNQDKPYDRFVLEQLAGDLLPPADTPQAACDQLTATGFLVLGPKMLAEQDKEKLVLDVVDEQIDTVGKTFLGLTLGCARCHDHKFDPLPTKDYYSLAGVFLSTRSMDHLDHVSQWLEQPQVGQEQRYLELRSKIDAKRQEQASAPADTHQETKEALAAEIQQLEAQLATIPRVMAVADQEPRDVPIHIRGSHLNLASETVPRGTTQLLEHQLPSPAIPPSTSGRLQLARWIVDPRNPLTARVMVNRIWQGHFGAGLVRTPSDFGMRGTPPTHPYLLDWLAQKFIDSGWSVKEMHRTIMLSSTYQMASTCPEPVAYDPENQLLWRQNRRRLEAEPLRDALFAVSGDLDLSLGGSLEDTPSDSLYARTTDAPFQLPRRAIYLPVVRNRVYEMFATFDYIDAGVHLEQRSTTNVPHQALFMMNDPLVIQQAERLAARLMEIQSDEERLQSLYLSLFARPVQEAERQIASRYLAGFAAHKPAEKVSGQAAEHPENAETPSHEMLAWTSLCRVLLAANEFVFID